MTHCFDGTKSIGMTALLVSVMAFFSMTAMAGPSLETEPQNLRRTPLDLTQTSLSGSGSGAALALQIAVAHSESVSGVGVLGGMPYACIKLIGSRLNTTDFNLRYAPCLLSAEPLPDPKVLYDDAVKQAEAKQIDPLSGLSRQRLWIFRGYNDVFVTPKLASVIKGFHKLSGAAPANIFVQEAIAAGHGPVSDRAGGDCVDPGTQGLRACRYDAAGSLLHQFYGALKPRAISGLTGRFQLFQQAAYAVDREAAGLAQIGYAYVPRSCDQGETCRVHVVLHDCGQSAEKPAGPDTSFIAGGGYNEWADENNLIILYPQLSMSVRSGCWDQWGYTGPDYATSEGKQVTAIWKMVQALAGPQVRMPPVIRNQKEGKTEGLGVADAGDRQIMLVWRPVRGATSYNIYRFEENNVINIRAMVSGLSAVDNDLAPETEYRYAVRAVVDGREQAWSEIVVGRTKPAFPLDCKPGTCADR